MQSSGSLFFLQYLVPYYQTYISEKKCNRRTVSIPWHIFLFVVQLMKLVEGAAHINFKNHVLNAKMVDMTTAARDLDGHLKNLSVEKEDLEQRGISLKVTV